MINLLPFETKKQYRAARINVLLLRYVFLLLTGAIFLSSAIVFAYYYLSVAAKTAESTVQVNSVKAQDFATVKQQANDFNAKLSEAKSILDGQMSYSKAILAIANALPEDTSLSTLQLDTASFSSPITLSIGVTGEASASRLLNSLRSSPHLSGVTRGKITISNNGKHPYIMEVTLTLNKEAL